MGGQLLGKLTPLPPLPLPPSAGAVGWRPSKGSHTRRSQFCISSYILPVSDCQFSNVSFVLPFFHCQFCIDSSVLPVLHPQFCNLSSVLQVLFLPVLFCQFCIVSSAMSALYCKFCIARSILPVPHCKFCNISSAFPVLYCPFCIAKLEFSPYKSSFLFTSPLLFGARTKMEGYLLHPGFSPPSFNQTWDISLEGVERKRGGERVEERGGGGGGGWGEGIWKGVGDVTRFSACLFGLRFKILLSAW